MKTLLNIWNNPSDRIVALVIVVLAIAARPLLYLAAAYIAISYLKDGFKPSKKSKSTSPRKRK